MVSGGEGKRVSEFATLNVLAAPQHYRVTLDRPAQKNSIDQTLLDELGMVLDRAEADPECRAFVLRGSDDVFCTGMDFSASVALEADALPDLSRRYMSLLARLSGSRLVTVAEVEGKVLAGGVGLVAASDIVIATPRTTFGLSEVLWGLLPACVLPYLVRRVGFQCAYSMTLLAETLGAEQAHRARLVDILSDASDAAVRRVLMKVTRVNAQTIVDLKRYVGTLWPIDATTAHAAVQESARLAALPEVRGNIARYVNDGTYPWERRLGARPGIDE